jgi:hypothetical protein
VDGVVDELGGIEMPAADERQNAGVLVVVDRHAEEPDLSLFLQVLDRRSR